MNILPLSLFCLCLCCGFSRGGQPPEGAPVRFRINMDQAAENKAPSTGPVPDQSTPLNAAKLLPIRKKRTGNTSRTSHCPPLPPL